MASATGLLTSYPEDTGLVNQAFTYDQALMGTALVQAGDLVSAGKIFNYYNSH